MNEEKQLKEIDDEMDENDIENEVPESENPETEDTTMEIFVHLFNVIATGIHVDMRENGFWDYERNEGELIALIHSELSEALEALRNDNPPDVNIPGYGNVEVELADAIIRIMDMAAEKDWNVAGAIIEKIKFNKKRGNKHGKLF